MHRPRGKPHALTRLPRSNIIFVWGHPVLAFYMLQTTVGMIMTYDSVLNDKDSDYYFRRMMSLGAFCQMTVLILMRVSHKGVEYMYTKSSRRIHFVVRIAFAFMHLSLRWYKGSSDTLMMYHALISFSVNCLDIVVALMGNKGKLTGAHFNSISIRKADQLRHSVGGGDDVELEVRNPARNYDDDTSRVQRSSSLNTHNGGDGEANDDTEYD